MPDDPSTAQQTVVGLLGPVTVAGVDVPGVRARRLLVSLALADGRTRSTDRLIDDVWGDTPPKSPQAALHTQISRLRHLLGDASIVGVGNGYRLDGIVSDIELVEATLVDGSATGVDAAANLWRGRPGDDLGSDDELAADLRRRAQAAHARIDEVRGTRALADGDYGTARTIAERRCAADPLDESAHIMLMRALAAQGRRSDALAVFARLRRRLATQLGVDPGAEAAGLNAELLAGSAPPASASTNVPAAQVDSNGRSPRRGRTIGLRAESTPLIGRDADLVAIIDLLPAHRVITVLGPGGVGKTRMANAVGNELAAQGRSTFLVPLASVRDDADVVAALAAALGVGETDIGSGGRPRLAVGDLADRLADAVRGQSAVLILDNCEHVIDECARIVDNLIAVESHLTVITTSRAPLLIAAEQVYPLPVLTVDGANSPAVELFTMRARSVRPSADLPSEKVAELCTHLDGLPLAIELAAARVRSMTVDEITRRLTARFDLLRSGDRTAPDRHRTLHAVIEWSWDLLDDDARAALRRLCRFPGGFSAAAAQIVVARSGADLDDTLSALVNQSLLEVSESDGEVRYRMLEMVREFGEEKLSLSGEGQAVDDAMASWARAYSRSVRSRYETAFDRTLVDSLAAELENLVWVLRQACDATSPRIAAADTITSVFPAVAAFWGMRGLHAEVRTWGVRIIAALPLPPSDPTDAERERWQFTLLAAAVHLLISPMPRSLARVRWCLRRLHRPDAAMSSPGDFLSSVLLARNILAAMRLIVRGAASSNVDVRRSALGMRMNLRENYGNLDAALLDSAQLRELAADSDPWLAAMTDVSTASIYGQQGQWRTALEFYRTGLANLGVIGAMEDAQQAGGYAVVTLIALGDLDAAGRELAVLADGWQRTDPTPQGNPEVIAGMMVCHGELARARHQDGNEYYWRAGDLLVQEHPVLSADPGAVMVLSVIVIGLVLGGDRDRARVFMAAIAAGVETTFSSGGWHDLPQAGAMSLAAGLVIAAEPGRAADGAALMLLGVRLKARRDYPALNEVRTRMRELAPLGDEEWTELAQRISRLSRRAAVAEVRRLLAKDPVR